VGADPHISSIRVAGTFQNLLGTADWDFAGGLPMDRDTSDPRGDFWTARTGQMLPAGFYEYKYLVTFDNDDSRIVTDPCARYSGFSNQNSAVVIGGSQPADNTIRPLPGGRRPLADLNLYELMIDDFTAEYRGDRAPLDAITDRLDNLQALGITAVLFMPWTAWQNDSFDWGYAPLQYFAVEARYAHDPTRPAEKLSWLKQLISVCHDRGIHVIMDGVFNHTSLDFPYKQLYRNQDDCPFTAGPFGGTFPGLQDLDFNNACTGEFIRDVCVYWMETFGIDGIRFDNTVNYYVAGNLHGLPELLADLSSWLDQKAEANFSFTLEHIDVSAATVTNTTAATSFWDNSLFSLCFQYLWDGQIDSRLLNALNNRRFLVAGKVPTLYLSNHDHSHAAWQAGARDNVGSTGAWWKLQPYLIALYTSTAVPLLPNGQEFGEDHFLPEDDHGTGRRVTSRPLQWKLHDDPIGQPLVGLHGTLARMRHDHPGLRSGLMYPDVWEEWQTQPNPAGVGVDVASQIVIYHRWAVLESGSVENFVIVINFSGTDAVPSVPFPVDGEWVDLLAGFDGSGSSWSATVLGLRAGIPVGSHWGRVLWHVNPRH
jgi:pullulanase